ncbi:Granulin [Nymphon striatum]|nr:Granulin [Nymphon striatum]
MILGAMLGWKFIIGTLCLVTICYGSNSVCPGAKESCKESELCCRRKINGETAYECCTGSCNSVNCRLAEKVSSLTFALTLVAKIYLIECSGSLLGNFTAQMVSQYARIMKRVADFYLDISPVANFLMLCVVVIEGIAEGHFLGSESQAIKNCSDTSCKASGNYMKLPNGQSGCCMYRKGNLCKDNSHCCPSFYRCSEDSSKCFRDASSFFSVIGNIKSVKITNICKEEESTSSKSSMIVCPDGRSECEDGYTCCQLESGQYGCCPYNHAVCCSDHIHCCPQGFRCSVSESSCVGHKNSVPMKRKLNASLSITSHSVNSVTCSSKKTCPDGFSCCKLPLGDYGCCPIPNAVCCSDHIHCCPEGSSCTGSGCQLFDVDENRLNSSHEYAAKYCKRIWSHISNPSEVKKFIKFCKKDHPALKPFLTSFRIFIKKKVVLFKNDSYTHLPLEVMQLHMLEELHLINFEIEDILDVLKRMPNLRILDFDQYLDSPRVIQNSVENLTHSFSDSDEDFSSGETSNEETLDMSEYSSRLEYLNIYNVKMTTLPTIFCKLYNIVHLDLSENSIETLPSDIGYLVNLNYLDISYNPIKYIPVELRNLTKLKVLNSSSTKIESFALHCPENLKVVILSKNASTVLHCFYVLMFIQTITMEKMICTFNHHNALSTCHDFFDLKGDIKLVEGFQANAEDIIDTQNLFLNERFEDCDQLMYQANNTLILNGNCRLCIKDFLKNFMIHKYTFFTLSIMFLKIKTVTKRIFELPIMNVLKLDNNAIEYIEGFEIMQVSENIKLLDISNNELKYFCFINVPDTIEEFYFRPNPFVYPPKYVLRSMDLHKIKKFLQDSLTYIWNCPDIKLIMLGESMSGKTTFCFNISSLPPIPTNVSSTRVIEFYELRFPNLDGIVKCYDIAGQSVYEMTHSLFFSENSLYILVLDISKFTDSKFYSQVGRWCDMLICFSPNAHVLILASHCDLVDPGLLKDRMNRTRVMWEEYIDMKKKSVQDECFLPTVEDILPINCRSRRHQTFSTVRDIVKAFFATKKHVEKRVPVSWNGFENLIVNDDSPFYISRETIARYAKVVNLVNLDRTLKTFENEGKIIRYKVDGQDEIFFHKPLCLVRYLRCIFIPDLDTLFTEETWLKKVFQHFHKTSNLYGKLHEKFEAHELDPETSKKIFELIREGILFDIVLEVLFENLYPDRIDINILLGFLQKIECCYKLEKGKDNEFEKKVLPGHDKYVFPCYQREEISDEELAVQNDFFAADRSRNLEIRLVKIPLCFHIFTKIIVRLRKYMTYQKTWKTGIFGTAKSMKIIIRAYESLGGTMEVSIKVSGNETKYVFSKFLCSICRTVTNIIESVPGLSYEPALVCLHCKKGVWTIEWTKEKYGTCNGCTKHIYLGEIKEIIDVFHQPICKKLQLRNSISIDDVMEIILEEESSVIIWNNFSVALITGIEKSDIEAEVLNKFHIPDPKECLKLILIRWRKKVQNDKWIDFLVTKLKTCHLPKSAGTF